MRKKGFSTTKHLQYFLAHSKCSVNVNLVVTLGSKIRQEPQAASGCSHTRNNVLIPSLLGSWPCCYCLFIIVVTIRWNLNFKKYFWRIYSLLRAWLLAHALSIPGRDLSFLNHNAIVHLKAWTGQSVFRINVYTVNSHLFKGGISVQPWWISDSLKESSQGRPSHWRAPQTRILLLNDKLFRKQVLLLFL